jgi:hypothetical protein
MKIQIHNLSSLPLIDYRTVKPLQGELKDLTDKNYQKLKNVLLKRGFTIPLFVWHNKEYYIMDGHGRQRVMVKEDMTPYEVPYVEIEAKNLKDAKTQLLEITSQYQTITQEGFDAFTADLPEVEDINFDALREQSGTREIWEYICPDCGHKNTIGAFEKVRREVKDPNKI